MIRLKRREFLAMAAVLPVVGGVKAVGGRVETRRVKVEIAFRSPGPKPNGLQATKEGLWVLDQSNNKAYLVTYENGQVLRALDTKSKAGSGITFDGEALWIASTYSCEILRIDAQTGKTLARYPSPGSGVVKWTASEARRSPLAPKPSNPSTPRKTDPPSAPRPITGAHGLEWKSGKLWIANPPSQRIYRVNPNGFVVEHQFPTAGNRPHGLGWEDDWLWGHQAFRKAP